jgi:ABC-type nitrate/sulfonate/bicarbonate transport system substrate-binding protein
VRYRVVLIAAIVGIAAVAGILATALWPSRSSALRLGMAPYQDLAMIVNIAPLGLEKKYGTTIELVTMGWEEILPSVATAGRGLDVGFASYSEFLTKHANLNPPGADPLEFIVPLYVYKGGALVTFGKSIPTLSPATISDASLAKQILNKKIGAQKGSLYEIMIYRLAELNDVKLSSVNLIDTPMDQGFIAAEQGSLDIASAGLTQLTEVLRRGGRAVLTMDDLRFADFTGFVVKRSVLEKRRGDINNLVRMWFDCVAFVYMDLDNNSATSRRYLDSAASTRYSLPEYKNALSQEYLPRSIDEARKEFLSDRGKFPFKEIGQTDVRFLMQTGAVKTPPPLSEPKFP